MVIASKNSHPTLIGIKPTRQRHEVSNRLAIE